jgi:hypothetical protein
MTDTYRSLCAELIKIVEEHCNPDEYALLDVVNVLSRARALQDQPEPQPPADGEVAELALLLRAEADDMSEQWLNTCQLLRVAELLESFPTTTCATLNRPNGNDVVSSRAYVE